MHAPRARCAYCRDGKESRPAHVCEVRGKYPEKPVIFTFLLLVRPRGVYIFLLSGQNNLDVPSFSKSGYLPWAS